MSIRLDVKHFAAHKGNFTSEASMLERLGWRSDMMMTLFNPKTGGSRTYDFSSVDRDRESDIMCWKYESSEGGTVTVFNT